MSDTGSLRSTSARDTTAREAVVRPLSRAAQRACVRPGCPSPAGATLSFRYDSREAWLERLSDEPRPEAYDLCSAHAARTQPPHGWQLRDRRPRQEQEAGDAPDAPADLGGEHTVAVLAAALRAVPDPQTSDDHDEPAAIAVTEAESLEDAASPVLEPLPSPSLGTTSAARPGPGGGGEVAAADVPEAAPSPSVDAVVPGGPVESETVPDPAPTLWSVDEEPAQPRPVLAARERTAASERQRTPQGPARDW